MSTLHPTIADEAKNLRRTEDRDAQRLIDRAKRKMPDSVDRRLVQTALADLRTSLREGLRGIMNNVLAGQLTPDKARDVAIEEQFAPIYQQAMRHGFGIAGLPDWKLTTRQSNALVSLIVEESQFFREFMKSLVPPHDEMSREQRLGLYGEASDDAFWRGWLMTQPSDTLISWRLGVAEHCFQCLKLAANGPYTKVGGSNPLPTVPRGGATKCLSNCRCFLESRIGSGAGMVISGLYNRVGVEITAIGRHKVDPNSPAALAAAILYQDLAERYVFFLRLAELLPGKGYDLAAAETLKILKDRAMKSGHSLRLMVTRDEILEPVRIAQAMQWRFVPPDEVDDDLLLAIAIVIGMNDSDRGKITATTSAPPTITLDGEDGEEGRTYRLDATGRNLLFIE